MRESAVRRYLVAAAFALLAGLLVHLWNPMDHFRADLRADAHGVQLSLELAARTIENACARS